MKNIDEGKIEELLSVSAPASKREIDSIIEKSKSLQRLSLQEAAVLLSAKEPGDIRKIFSAAGYVKDAVYGRRIVLFAPVYISNACLNRCLYCGFRSDNRAVARKELTIGEIKEQAAWLLQRGHKRILMVAAESSLSGADNIRYYVQAVKAIYSAAVGLNRIKRVNVNCAPLSIDEFKALKSAGIGTYQLFQETYHEAAYRKVHMAGPKSDPDNRIEAIDRAFLAGIDDIGIGVLYGLYDWRFETLALLMHIEHLEKRFKVGPHTISVPRIEPAVGVDFTKDMPYRVCDDDFKKIVAVLRLAVPYTGIILSTREAAQMRDELFDLGVSQVSAESRTSPGGYTGEAGKTDEDTQFCLNDARSLDQVIGSLIDKKFIPSFCAACYRKERTGETFMNLARPGAIKNKCSINALVTLKEYLDDFASAEVRQKGYRLLGDMQGTLAQEERVLLCGLLGRVAKGARDEYV